MLEREQAYVNGSADRTRSLQLLLRAFVKLPSAWDAHWYRLADDYKARFDRLEVLCKSRLRRLDQGWHDGVGDQDALAQGADWLRVRAQNVLEWEALQDEQQEAREELLARAQGALHRVEREGAAVSNRESRRSHSAASLGTTSETTGAADMLPLHRLASGASVFHRPGACAALGERSHLEQMRELGDEIQALQARHRGRVEASISCSTSKAMLDLQARRSEAYAQAYKEWACPTCRSERVAALLLVYPAHRSTSRAKAFVASPHNKRSSTSTVSLLATAQASQPAAHPVKTAPCASSLTQAPTEAASACSAASQECILDALACRSARHAGCAASIVEPSAAAPLTARGVVGIDTLILAQPSLAHKISLLACL